MGLISSLMWVVCACSPAPSGSYGKDHPHDVLLALSTLQPRTFDTTEGPAETLESFTLLDVTAGEENSIHVSHGAANPVLQSDGWVSFLVSVRVPEAAGCRIKVSSPEARSIIIKSGGEVRPLQENAMTALELSDRKLQIRLFQNEAISTVLSGLKTQYAIVQLYTRSRDHLDATFVVGLEDCPKSRFMAGQAHLSFSIEPSSKVVLKIEDSSGRPLMASVTVYDGINRLVRRPDTQPLPSSIEDRLALRPHWERIWVDNTYVDSVSPIDRKIGIYPFPASRHPDKDEFPDLYFQAQVYRQSGEYIRLAPGEYQFVVSRGPEFLPVERSITVETGVAEQTAAFTLQRWIDPGSHGWFSSDLHVHAAGCKHTEQPSNGLRPHEIWRQAKGEGLDVVGVLNWGVGWHDHRPEFYEQADGARIAEDGILRYDVEVSEFPSGHLGHLALLNLRDDNYPGAETVGDWPSWTAPVLRWARAQGASTGYLHSGWGMEPSRPTSDLPNFEIPKLNGIGANELPATVTQGLVDLYGVGDTTPSQELNLWYHVLNTGQRLMLMGESDWPCIYHEKMGIARSYTKLGQLVDFEQYLQAMLRGDSYVSDGYSHIWDFSVSADGATGAGNEIHLQGQSDVVVEATVAAYLSQPPTDLGRYIASSSSQRQPAWSLERARLGESRSVAVELIVNGQPVARQVIKADGERNVVRFRHATGSSSWFALRIFPSSHTNPKFVIVGGDPVRASKASARWLRLVIEAVWEKKKSGIRPDEREAARAFYDSAIETYRKLEEQAASD